MKDYTLIYSSASVDALEKMINEFLYTFNIPLKANDMFAYGVFCKDSTYAFYQFWENIPNDIEIPSMLTNTCNTPTMKLDYVNQLIHDICFGIIEKPEWMIYVEMETNCTEYELTPSTFLYLFHRKEEYRKLSEKIINFLYSPNLLVTMVK